MMSLDQQKGRLVETVVNYSPTMRVVAIDAQADVFGLEVWDDNRKRWRPSQLLTLRAAQLLVPLFEG